jgi:hypothetical protein
VFVLSLFIGAALALLRDRLDTRLGTEAEISDALDLPILGRIPRVKSSQRAQQGFAEAFRVLNTNLGFLHPKSTISTTLVTSASPSEGKSTVSLGIARAIAEQGRRVVLVEGDLRRPTLADSLQLDGSSVGVAHYLALGWSFEDVVRQAPTQGLYVVPAGAIPPNPSALLQPQAIARLLADAKLQMSLPELRPGLTLLNRLWPLLFSTLGAGILGVFIPQVSAVAAGFAIIWALAWRRQESAVAAIEDRDGFRFYVDRTPPYAPIRLIRTPGLRTG